VKWQAELEAIRTSPAASGKLFVLAFHVRVAIVVEFDADYVGMAANGAILDEFMHTTLGEVERYHDLFAARVADVADLIAHESSLPLLLSTSSMP
jgi:hypothetical protein